jgi:predicted permease
MNWLRSIRTRFRALFRKRELDADMDDEMRSHIEFRMQSNIEAGMNAQEARFAALRQFGWTESIKETCREQRGVTWLENLAQDIRSGARQLRKNPGFTAVAVGSLGLGIGAGTAVFSLVNAILLSSLPVPNPQELVAINWSGAEFTSGYDGELLDAGPNRKKGNAFSHSVFLALRDRCSNQAEVFGYVPLNGVTARARREATSAEGLMVSDNFFPGLGVRPVLGRMLVSQDEDSETAPNVVISYRWWERQFDLDPGALGSSVKLNGKDFTVVGVLPREFSGVSPGAETDLYIPLAQSTRDRWQVPLMARLKSGVGKAQFLSALEVVFNREAEGVMKEPMVLLSEGRAGPDSDRRRYRSPLILLLSVVGVVLLVVCANLAGLSLARGTSRKHEFAVRAALGAGRWQLVRQSLTESTLVAVIGGGLGVAIAVWGKNVFSRLLSGSPEGLHYNVQLDLKVLGFALAVSLITALLSGILPAMRAAAVDPRDGLNARATVGIERHRSGRFLVAAQIALSLLLLAGAGLYVRTLVNLTEINPGFAQENLLLFKLNPGDAGYEAAQATAFFDRTRQSLEAFPGVRSVALTQVPLLSGGSWVSSFVIPGRPSEDGGESLAHMLIVSETFFKTLGVPLLLGRDFNVGDAGDAAKVVVVNEAFVRKYFPGESPIGRTLKRDGTDWHVVGVCRDIKYADIKSEVPPTAYLSFRQESTGSAFFALRTSLPPLSVSTAARKVVAAMDPNIPLTDLSTQLQIRDRTISQQRMFAFLCGSLAVLAVLLSFIGLYGLMTYHVSRRTREIGLRMALGATRERILRRIVAEGLTLGGLGLVVGLLLTIAFSKLIRSQLYGVEPTDPLTLGAAVFTLLLIAAGAAWVPARQAARVDPMEALRSE